MHVLSLWFYENVLFYFCPIYEWTNTNSWVKKQTPSRTKPKSNFKFEYFDFSIHKDIRKTWVEFVVDSLLCSERFFSGYSGFPLSLKTNTSKFQFDLERTDTFTRVQWTPKCFVGKQITIYNLQLANLKKNIYKYRREGAELEFKTMDTVVHRFFSDWNLRIYLP